MHFLAAGRTGKRRAQHAPSEVEGHLRRDRLERLTKQWCTITSLSTMCCYLVLKVRCTKCQMKRTNQKVSAIILGLGVRSRKEWLCPAASKGIERQIRPLAGVALYDERGA